MSRSVPFTLVLSLLEQNGYQLAKRRKYPDRSTHYFVLFACPGRPMIGFPVAGKRVLRKHFERIKKIISDFDQA